MSMAPGYEVDWNLVRTFVSVVEAGSLAGALAGLARGYKKTKQVETEKGQAQVALVQTVKGIDKAIKAGAIQIDKFALAMDSKQSHATKDMVDVIQGKAA